MVGQVLDQRMQRIRMGAMAKMVIINIREVTLTPFLQSYQHLFPFVASRDEISKIHLTFSDCYCLNTMRTYINNL